MESWVLDGVAQAADFREVPILLLACLRIAREEICDGVLVEMMPIEIVRIDAVGTLGPLGFETDDGVIC